MSGRELTDAIFVLCQILEKGNKHNVKMHIHIIDFKSAFDII